VFLEAIFNLDGPVEKLGKEAEPGVYLFEEPCNFTRAFLSVFGEARVDRGLTCLKLCRIVLQSVGTDEARRRDFLLILLASSHFIGKELFNQLWKELYTVDELYADLDSISGGEFSRRKQEAIRLALDEERARAAVELKEVEARAEAEVKGLEAEVARLEGIIDAAGLSKGPGER
jgi:hypothetical protein